MHDLGLFVFGGVVTVIAVTGGWLFVYAKHFRPAYMEEAVRERRTPRPRTSLAGRSAR